MQTRMQLDQSETDVPRESFGDLLGKLANNSAALVRDEIELAKQEMSEKVTALRSAIIMASIGALIGFVAILTLTAAAVIGLTHYVSAGYAALIVGVALAVIGGATALTGLRQINRINFKPRQTIQTLEEDKQWLKQLT